MKLGKTQFLKNIPVRGILFAVGGSDFLVSRNQILPFFSDSNENGRKWKKMVSSSQKITHLATRRRSDVVTTSLWMSQRRRRYVSNETPNDVSVEPLEDVSVVRLRDILLECRDDILRGRNNDVPSVRLHDFSNKSQMKHPTTSQWYVSLTSH